MNHTLASDHKVVTIDGMTITIRPITEDDKDIEAAFVKHLSLDTKHERFLEGIKELSPRMLKTLCEIDYVNTMAYVATITVDGKEKEIGVSRYAKGANADEREFALTVADDVPYQKIGSLLLDALIEHARANNVKRLFSVELYSNKRIKHLAEQYKMSSHEDKEDHTQVIYTLVL